VPVDSPGRPIWEGDSDAAKVQGALGHAGQNSVEKREGARIEKVLRFGGPKERQAEKLKIGVRGFLGLSLLFQKTAGGDKVPEKLHDGRLFRGSKKKNWEERRKKPPKRRGKRLGSGEIKRGVKKEGGSRPKKRAVRLHAVEGRGDGLKKE